MPIPHHLVKRQLELGEQAAGGDHFEWPGQLPDHARHGGRDLARKVRERGRLA
jgi:hypothetical protein